MEVGFTVIMRPLRLPIVLLKITIVIVVLVQVVVGGCVAAITPLQQ
jgi:hypothetical protein